MDREISEKPECKLLKKVSRGDEEAFNNLYNLTHKKVFFYLYRFFQDREKAEDLLIDTFTAVWTGAGNYKGRSQVTTWIFGIARNLAMNELRKMRFHENIDDHDNISDIDDIPDLGQFDRKRIIQDAMLRISFKHREVLDLVFFHEMHYQEISEILRVSVNTVKTRVFYAKEAVKTALAQAGVGSDDL